MTINNQPSFDTVTEALQWLNQQGFSHDFNLDEDCLRFDNNSQSMSPNEFSIEYVFRFEGDTDPGDEDIVYGITSDVYNIKGVLTSAFGIYADSLSSEMIKKLSTH
ncbi:phosphoribosylpyrophosphate synthetase [Flavobacterium sp. DG1-102-2]|uniref:phosphoribosylpyrophosphate synthetase n=1 Tax=Flavobacterium sp. DG1-102-2 TaxID=3081663 RepID=UPI00294A4896|nr:phosphoribosylpyrophosphate synthetase [Flavobacterium sp. DG1-102-2]MDV6167354.1 phosphoribosylpyrophosphate synthetase [Flavobacterium sp. DG1-102-2]